MDYKRIVKSKAVRVMIMRALSFVPDKPMLQLQYRIKTGRKLDLKNPKRFTEKLQWYKVYYRDPLMAQCADKYTVREYVTSHGYSSILNGLIGLYNDPDEVTFESLPQQFVLKSTLGGGGNEVIICRDKSELDIPATKKRMAKWVKPRIGKNIGREWVYDGRQSRIVAEAYIPSDPSEGGLIDYKFFCFNGKCAYVYVIADRKVGQKAGIGIVTPDYRFLPYVRADEKPLERTVPKPDNWSEMLAVAEDLARPFPHARIDFYDVQGKVIFGEITFFDGSGYMTFDPDEFDFMLGEPFVLPKKNYW